MNKKTLISILASSILLTPMLNADWDQVITFDEFEVGAYRSPDDPISQLVKVVRDEGYEGGRTEGFATHHIVDNRAGGKMYGLTTGGAGYNWGHVFAAIDLDQDATGTGTLYTQWAVEGISNNFNVGLQGSRTEPGDEEDQARNPWGWTNIGHWPAFALRFANVMQNGRISINDAGTFRNNPDFNFTPGSWVEVWVPFDLESGMYEVWIRDPENGYPEITNLSVPFEDEMFGDYFLADQPDALRSFYMGIHHGQASNPFLGHRWYTNVIALDFENWRNFTTPAGVAVPPGFSPTLLVYGFRQIEDWGLVDALNFLGASLWITQAPYVYSFDLELWMWIPWLWLPDEEHPEGGRPREQTQNLAARQAEWVYIWDNPFDPGWQASMEFNTWVWTHESGWTYVWNSLR